LGSGVFPSFDSAVTGTSEIPKLLSSYRSQRPETFMSHLSTKSDELGKICPSSNSEGLDISNMCKFLEYNKSQKISEFTSQHNAELSECHKKLASGHVVIGAIDGIRFVESQKLETSAGQSKAEETGKVPSHCGGTDSVSESLQSRSNKSVRIFGATSQNEIESHDPGKALAYNHGEVEAKDVAAVLIPKHLQSHGSCTQPRVAAETSGTPTSILFKSKIPQRIGGPTYKGMKEFKEFDSTVSSYHPTTNKQCIGMSSWGSFPVRGQTFGKLDTGQCDKPIVNPGKSRLSSAEQTVAPVHFASTNSRTFTSFINPEIANEPTTVESKEHDNISTSYSGRITKECLWSKIARSPRVSGISGSIATGTVTTRSKRKRFMEESTDRSICTASDSPLKQGFEKFNSGKPDNHTESSFLHNVAASRLVEKSSEPNMPAELMNPSTKETYRPLNITTESAIEDIPTTELQYPEGRKVSLMRKPSGISATEINSMQNNSNENSITQNQSMMVFQKNDLPDDLHESSKMMVPHNTVSDQTFTVANKSTSAVSVATQTDLIAKNNTPVQTGNLICSKSAVAKLLALFESQEIEIDCVLKEQKKQEEKIQAIQKKSNVIHKEMVNILNGLNNDMFREGNNVSSDVGPGYNYKNSEESPVSRTPLRRSERIAQQASVTVTGDRTFCRSKSVGGTPVRLKWGGSPSARSVARRSTAKLKSASVYKELRSSFHFLKTPQSTRQLRVRTPKNTPNRILSQRLQDQILSLYN
jgi:hypothetical protein